MPQKDNIIIAIDFDGTCVEHEYPLVGKDVPNVVEVLRRIIERYKPRIILYTMRSSAHLADAVNWFADNKIELWGINENPDQHNWTVSPKIYAHFYIDDAALGTPLIHPGGGKRPYVDWLAVEKLLDDHHHHTNPVNITK